MEKKRKNQVDGTNDRLVKQKVDENMCSLYVDGLKYQSTSGCSNRVEFCQLLGHFFQFNECEAPQCDISEESWQELSKGRSAFAFITYADIQTMEMAQKHFDQMVLSHESIPETTLSAFKPPTEDQFEPFQRLITHVFQVDDIVPDCAIPSISELRTGRQRGLVLLQYPTPSSAEAACKAFHQKDLSDDVQQTTVTVELSRDNDCVVTVDPVPLATHLKVVSPKDSSSSSLPDRCSVFCEAIAKDFQVAEVKPECNVPHKNWKYIEEGRESYVFLTYPTYKQAEDAIQQFHDRLWPFDESISRRKRLRMKHSDVKSSDVFLDGVYDTLSAPAPVLPAEPMPEQVRRFADQIAMDFRLGEAIPQVDVAKKNWGIVMDHKETYVFLTYGSPSMARDAVREFNDVNWPFARDAKRKMRLRVSKSSKNNLDVYVGGVFLPEETRDRSQSPRRDVPVDDSTYERVRHFSKRLESDFRVDNDSPLCNIPKKNWIHVLEGRETFAFLSYQSPERVTQAIKMFTERQWPFDVRVGRTNQIRLIRSENGPDMVLLKGIFDDLIEPQVAPSPIKSEDDLNSPHRRFCQQLGRDFAFDGIQPTCTIPQKNWSIFVKGGVSYVFLGFPSVDLAERARRRFNDRFWPFDAERGSRETRLRANKSEINERIIHLYGVFLPKERPSEPATACRELEELFTIDRCVPKCRISSAAWDTLKNKAPASVSLTYSTRRLADDAAAYFRQCRWSDRLILQPYRDTRVTTREETLWIDNVFYGPYPRESPRIDSTVIEFGRDLSRLFRVNGDRPECTFSDEKAMLEGHKTRAFFTYATDRSARAALREFENQELYSKKSAYKVDLRACDPRQVVLESVWIEDHLKLRPMSARYKEFCRSIVVDFKVCGLTPECHLPTKNWTYITEGCESYVFLSYPTFELAQQAIELYNEKQWPFDASAARRKALRMQPCSKHRLNVFVDGVYERSDLCERVYRFCNFVLPEFRIEHETPCTLTIPWKNWSTFSKGNEVYGFLEYSTPELADKAITLFNNKSWPFYLPNSRSSARLRLSSSEKSKTVFVHGLYELDMSQMTDIIELQDFFTIKDQARPNCKIIPDPLQVILTFSTQEEAQEAVDLFWTQDWPPTLVIQVGEDTRIQLKEGNTVVMENVVRTTELDRVIAQSRSTLEKIKPIDEFIAQVDTLTSAFANQRDTQFFSALSFRPECKAFVQEAVVHSWSNFKLFIEKGKFRQFLSTSDKNQAEAYLQDINQRLSYAEFQQVLLSHLTLK